MRRECEATAFAWTGSRAPSLHQDGDLLAVFDGTIFNAEDFGAKPPANHGKVLADVYRQKGFRGAIQAFKR